MKSKIIEIESYIGFNLKNELIMQSGETLVIQLPGGKYTIMAPYMYYSYNIALEQGCDVLTIEYGFQRTNKPYCKDDLPNIVKECKEIINKALAIKKYKRIIFCGKCIGCEIQTIIAPDYQNYNTEYIFITPYVSSIPLMKNKRSLLIIGTNDPVFKREHIEEVSSFNNVKVFTIKGANHDLDTDKYDKSIEMLLHSCRVIEEFIR
ncbi:alpha/beta hydrolase [Abyssisolibacter fermentans]|uniref:alpha/beta hydrolase n=1 Tax=Abyssisolibacter fermentans TaxID=1766203 RepID=UPI00082F1666|nr:alpha/beta hydrolase [Abyssisolibacter fermentans]